MNLRLRTKTDLASGRYRRLLAATATVGATIALGACSTAMTGTGSGDLMHAGANKEPARISWTSDKKGLSGTMVVTLPDVAYQGHFFEITSQTREESLVPLWEGWDAGWYSWPYWENQPNGQYALSEFATRYSGKVLANLSAPDGSRMRCRMQLTHPQKGMAGGGDGECQLASQKVIRVRF